MSRQYDPRDFQDRDRDRDEDRWNRPSDDRDRRDRYSDREDWRRYDDPYDDRPRNRPQGSSMPGIVSFIIGIASGLVICVLIVVAVILTLEAGGNLDENSPEAMIVGLGIIGALGLALVGLILGIIGLGGDRPLKVLAGLGVVFNGLILLGTLGLIVLGIAVG
jgi:hypothetical protein